MMYNSVYWILRAINLPFYIAFGSLIVCVILVRVLLNHVILAFIISNKCLTLVHVITGDIYSHCIVVVKVSSKSANSEIDHHCVTIMWYKSISHAYDWLNLAVLLLGYRLSLLLLHPVLWYDNSRYGFSKLVLSNATWVWQIRCAITIRYSTNSLPLVSIIYIHRVCHSRVCRELSILCMRYGRATF